MGGSTLGKDPDDDRTDTDDLTVAPGPNRHAGGKRVLIVMATLAVLIVVAAVAGIVIHQHRVSEPASTSCNPQAADPETPDIQASITILRPPGGFIPHGPDGQLTPVSVSIQSLTGQTLKGYLVNVETQDRTTGNTFNQAARYPVDIPPYAVPLTVELNTPDTPAAPDPLGTRVAAGIHLAPPANCAKWGHRVSQYDSAYIAPASP